MCSRVCSTTWPRSLVRRSSSWSARAITTSHCLTRLSLIVACSVSRSRSAFTASVSAGWSGPGLTSSGASSFLVSASSLRAMAAAAKRRRPDVGRLLAQGVDLRRHQAFLVGTVGDAVELPGPQLDELRERPLRRRHALRRKPGVRQPANAKSRQARREEAPPSSPSPVIGGGGAVIRDGRGVTHHLRCLPPPSAYDADTSPDAGEGIRHALIIRMPARYHGPPLISVVYQRLLARPLTRRFGRGTLRPENQPSCGE